MSGPQNKKNNNGYFFGFLNFIRDRLHGKTEEERIVLEGNDILVKVNKLTEKEVQTLNAQNSNKELNSLNTDYTTSGQADRTNNQENTQKHKDTPIDEAKAWIEKAFYTTGRTLDKNTFKHFAKIRDIRGKFEEKFPSLKEHFENLDKGLQENRENQPKPSQTLSN